MSVAFVQGSPTFPAGTVLRAYDKRFFGGEAPQRGTGPSGPEVDSATVTSLGGATFEHLSAEQTYYIGAQVSGVYRWITLRMPPPEEGEPSGGGEGISQAEADLRYLQIATAAATYLPFIENAPPQKITAGEHTLPGIAEQSVHQLLIEGNATIKMPPLPSTGSSVGILIILKQVTPGNHTVLFTPMKWAGGEVPTATAPANSVDMFGAIAVPDVDGFHWLGVIPGQAYA